MRMLLSNMRCSKRPQAWFYVIVFENLRFRPSTRKHENSVFESLHPGKRFWKSQFSVAENAVYVWTRRQNGEKNFRFHKYPNTCGRGLRLLLLLRRFWKSTNRITKFLFSSLWEQSLNTIFTKGQLDYWNMFGNNDMAFIFKLLFNYPSTRTEWQHFESNTFNKKTLE